MQPYYIRTAKTDTIRQSTDRKETNALANKSKIQIKHRK